MTICCSVRSVVHSVNFDSDIDLFPYFSTKKYSKYIPEYHVQREAADTDFTVVYRNNGSKRVSFEETRITIEYPWDFMRAGESILYLGYPLIEAQNQDQGMSTVHSAAFSVDNKGVLLLGDAGCGKTSIIMHATRYLDAKLVSNDLTIVGSEAGKVQAHGGTKFFHIRKTAVEQNMPWISGLFDGRDVDPWVDKLFLTSEELEIPTQKETVEISSIYRIHVDNRRESVTYRPLDGLQTKLFLNEQLSRFIRNVTTAVMVGPNYEIVAPVPSFDTARRFGMRNELMEAMMVGTGITYLSGPLNLVLDHISSRL